MQLWQIEAWDSKFAPDKLNWNKKHVVFEYKNKHQKFTQWTRENFKLAGSKGIPAFEKALLCWKVLGPNQGDPGMFLTMYAIKSYSGDQLLHLIENICDKSDILLKFKQEFGTFVKP